MNTELGFGCRLLHSERHGSLEHMTGIVHCLVVADAQLDGNWKILRNPGGMPATWKSSPKWLSSPPSVKYGFTPGIAARLFTALGNAGINVRMIDQGSSEINIIIGVATEDFELAIRAVYHAFVK